jgi:hypothetical protein
VRHACGEAKRAHAEGRAIDPALTPAQIAGRKLLLAALASDYERAARGIVFSTNEPIELAHGVVLGLKPVTTWNLAPKWTDEHGRLTPAKRAALVEELRLFHMTDAQAEEWFGMTREGDFAGAVKKALQELLGRHARDFIERGYFIEPATAHEFAPWMPATGKAPAAQTLEEMLDDIGF